MIQYSEPSILKKKVAPDIDLMSFELYVQSTPKWQQWVWVHSAGADIYKYSMQGHCWWNSWANGGKYVGK